MENEKKETSEREREWTQASDSDPVPTHSRFLGQVEKEERRGFKTRVGVFEHKIKRCLTLQSAKQWKRRSGSETQSAQTNTPLVSHLPSSTPPPPPLPLDLLSQTPDTHFFANSMFFL